jgi:hypothetical protein
MIISVEGKFHMAVLPSCANCGTALTGPYCSNCGQKSSDLNRPIWWIFGEFLDAVFSYDSRTFRTIWLLVAEPGAFTRRYIAGQRASLLPPFRLFVIATVVFFLTLQFTDLALVAFKVRNTTAADVPVTVTTTTAPGGQAATSRVRSGTTVEMELFVPASSLKHVKLTEQQKKDLHTGPVQLETDGASPEDADALRMMEKSLSKVTQGYQKALEDPMKLNGPLNVWLPRLMLVLVPVFALLLGVMHWWPRVYLMEHLIFSLHLHTVVFFAMAVSALVASILGGGGFLWAVWLILLVYVWMAMHLVYARSWWLTSIKFVAALSVYSIVLMGGLATVFALALAEL